MTTKTARVLVGKAILALVCVTTGCKKQRESPAAPDQLSVPTNISTAAVVHKNSEHSAPPPVSNPLVDVHLVSFGSVEPQRTKVWPGRIEGIKDTVVSGTSDLRWPIADGPFILKGRTIRGLIVKLTSSVATNTTLSLSNVVCFLKHTNSAPHFFQVIETSGCELSYSGAKVAEFNPLVESFNGKSDLRFPAILGETVSLQCDFQMGGTVTVGIAFETFDQSIEKVRIADKTFTARDIETKRVN